MLRRDQGKKRFGQRTLRRNNKYEKTCRYPNRLNLLNSTAGLGGRSIFFSLCAEFVEALAAASAATTATLTGHPLPTSPLRRELPAEAT